MENKRIAFQGEPGAYSEQALFLLEPHAEAVVQGRADLGLLPIENSLVGSIATNFDLIAESGLAIVGEVVSSVHHCLLGVAGASRESWRSGSRTSRTTRRASCWWRRSRRRRRPACRRRRRCCSSCRTGPARWRARSRRSPPPGST